MIARVAEAQIQHITVRSLLTQKARHSTVVTVVHSAVVGALTLVSMRSVRAVTVSGEIVKTVNPMQSTILIRPLNHQALLMCSVSRVVVRLQRTLSKTRINRCPVLSNCVQFIVDSIITVESLLAVCPNTVFAHTCVCAPTSILVHRVLDNRFDCIASWRSLCEKRDWDSRRERVCTLCFCFHFSSG